MLSCIYFSLRKFSIKRLKRNLSNLHVKQLYYCSHPPSGALNKIIHWQLLSLLVHWLHVHCFWNSTETVPSLLFDVSLFSCNIDDKQNLHKWMERTFSLRKWVLTVQPYRFQGRLGDKNTLSLLANILHRQLGQLSWSKSHGSKHCWWNMCLHDGILLQQIRSPSTKSSKQIEQQLGKQLKAPMAAEERYSSVLTEALPVRYCFMAVDDLSFSWNDSSSGRASAVIESVMEFLATINSKLSDLVFSSAWCRSLEVTTCLVKTANTSLVFFPIPTISCGLGLPVRIDLIKWQ